MSRRAPRVLCRRAAVGPTEGPVGRDFTSLRARDSEARPGPASGPGMRQWTFRLEEWHANAMMPVARVARVAHVHSWPWHMPGPWHAHGSGRGRGRPRVCSRSACLGLARSGFRHHQTATALITRVRRPRTQPTGSWILTRKSSAAERRTSCTTTLSTIETSAGCSSSKREALLPVPRRPRVRR